MSAPRVVVLGGGGFLGLSTVPALIAAGIVPVCGRRARSNVLGLRQHKVPLVLADLDSPDTVQQAVQGADCVVHLAGHYPKLSLNRDATLALATRQMQTLLDAVAEGGARRLIYVSSTATAAQPGSGTGSLAPLVAGTPATGPSAGAAVPPLRGSLAPLVAGTPATGPSAGAAVPPLRGSLAPLVAGTPATGPSAGAAVPPLRGSLATEVHRYPTAPGFGTYHDVKWHLEALVDAETRFETLTVCPGACVGPHDYRLGTAAFLAATARRLSPQHPDGWVNVVDVRDVGLAIARLVSTASPPRRLLLSGTPWRLHDLLEQVAPRYHAPTPQPALSAQQAIALADEEEHRIVAAGKGRPQLSRELVDLVVHGVPVDASLSKSTLGLEYRTLDDTLEAFDVWARKIGLLVESPTTTPENHTKSNTEAVTTEGTV